MTTPAPILAVTYGLPAGGAEKLLVSILRGLDRARFAPTLVSLGPPGPLESQLPPDMPFHRFQRRGGLDPVPAKRIAELMAERKFTSAIALDLFSKVFILRAERASGMRMRTAVSQHTLHAATPVAAMKTFLYARALREGDLLVTVTTMQADLYAARHRVPRAGIRVISGGVDTEYFTPDRGEDRTRVRSELGITPDTPLIVQVGALRPEKRHDIAVEALAIVNRTAGGAVHLLLVGDGPAGRMEEVKQLANRHGVREQLHCVGYRHDVRPYLRAADLFTLTSAWEAFPLSALEALACGVPCVVTARGGTGEIVRNERQGRLVPPGEPRAFAAAWGEMLASRGMTDRNELHSGVAREFPLTRCITAYESLLTFLSGATG